MFLLNACKNKISVLQKEVITSGAVNVLKVKFQFDADWAGMSRWAVFRVGSVRKCIELDDSNQCCIPWECLRENDIGSGLDAGAYGMIGDTIVMPTVWCRLGTIMEGVKLGDAVLPATPSAAEQILSQMLAIRDEILGVTPPEEDDPEPEPEEPGDDDVATDEEVNDALDDIFGN